MMTGRLSKRHWDSRQDFDAIREHSQAIRRSSNAALSRQYEAQQFAE
jgi:hypothetical protein